MIACSNPRLSEGPAMSVAADTPPPQRLDSASLEALYGTLIEPQLIGFEAERISAMRKFWLRLVIGAPLALILGAVIGNFMSAGWGMGIGAFALALVGAYAYAPLEAVAKKAK